MISTKQRVIHQVHKKVKLKCIDLRTKILIKTVAFVDLPFRLIYDAHLCKCQNDVIRHVT